MCYIKRVLICFFLLISSFARGQQLVQIFTDRCTGETKVFTVDFNGRTVITFYDQSRVFTASDFQSGALQTWLEGVYAAYAALSPCSSAQAETNATQQAVNQSANAASQAATNAASSPPPNTNTNANTSQTPPANDPPPDTGSTNANQNTGDQGGNTSTGGGDSQADGSSGATGSDQSEGTSGEANQETGTGDDSSSSTEESSQSQEENSSSSEDASTEGESQDDGGDTDDGQASEETDESESESEVDESSEEESESKEEESQEEEKSEEESEEESSEESSEEEEEESKEEKKKKKKKKNSNPPVIVANISSMQNLDGRFQQAMTLGLSKTSLRGDKSYALTGMVWQNLKQYMLMGTYSKIFFDKGRPRFIYSAGLGASKMFTTLIFMNNHSLVYMGDKGGVYGISAGANVIYLDYTFKKASLYVDDAILSGALTGFFTKPYNFDRYSVSPMLAISKSFVSYGIFDKSMGQNKDFMAITGVSSNYNLTKRFVVNLGLNAIHNTNNQVPTLWNITIGSRFQF